MFWNDGTLVKKTVHSLRLWHTCKKKKVQFWDYGTIIKFNTITVQSHRSVVHMIGHPVGCDKAHLCSAVMAHFWHYSFDTFLSSRINDCSF